MMWIFILIVIIGIIMYFYSNSKIADQCFADPDQIKLDNELFELLSNIQFSSWEHYYCEFFETITTVTDKDVEIQIQIYPSQPSISKLVFINKEIVLNASNFPRSKVFKLFNDITQKIKYNDELAKRNQEERDRFEIEKREIEEREKQKKLSKELMKKLK